MDLEGPRGDPRWSRGSIPLCDIPTLGPKSPLGQVRGEYPPLVYAYESFFRLGLNSGEASRAPVSIYMNIIHCSVKIR